MNRKIKTVNYICTKYYKVLVPIRFDLYTEVLHNMRYGFLTPENYFIYKKSIKYDGNIFFFFF